MGGDEGPRGAHPASEGGESPKASSQEIDLGVYSFFFFYVEKVRLILKHMLSMYACIFFLIETMIRLDSLHCHLAQFKLHSPKKCFILIMCKK